MAFHRTFAFVALIALSSCKEPTFPAQTPDKVAGATITNDDRAIYDALVDHYAHEGLILGACFPPPPDERHPLSETELRERRERAAIHFSAFTEPIEWKYPNESMTWELPGGGREKMAVSDGAYKNFQSRNRQKASLESYKPRGLTVLATPDKSNSTLALSLPGYSFGSRYALVSVFCTPHVEIPHVGTSGEFVYLQKENGRWRVIAQRPMWIE